MRAFLLVLALVLTPSCSVLPDGSRALSVEAARAALEAAADDVGQADLNGDGMLQLDSRSGLPLAELQAYLRGSAESLLAPDTNHDGMLDSRELLGAAPFMAARLYAAAGLLETRPADGSPAELAMLGLLLTDRLMQELR